MQYEVSDALWNERESRFMYHVPFGDQAERYAGIRERIANFSHFLDVTCPPSRELSIAMTKLDEVMFFANASIARNENKLGEE